MTDFEETIGRLTAENERLRQELTRERAIRETIMANVPASIVYFDTDLVFRAVNTLHDQVTGLPAEAKLGRRIRDVVPTMADKVEPLYRRVMETGQPHPLGPYPYQVGQAGVGKAGYYDGTFLNVPGPDGGSLGVLSIGVEVTDRIGREKAEHALARERSLLEALLEHVPASLSFVDRNMVFQWLNRQATDILGVQADHLVGRTPKEVYGEAAGARFESMRRHVLDTRTPYHDRDVELSFMIDGRTSTTFWDVAYMPVTVQDEIIGVLSVSHEVSDRVERERRGREQIAALEQADGLKDEFLSMVSHELRTPVHIVMGYLRLLNNNQAEPLTESQRATVRKALYKAEDLAGIIGALLDASQLQAGTLRLALDTVALTPFLTDVAVPLVDLAIAAGLKMTVEIPPELPTARIDTLRVSQVLTNLVGNAVKFTQADGSIRLTAVCPNDRLRVEVTDTGRGIPAEWHAQIFERFVQADMSFTREAGGVGLGLAIARQLVEAHGGTIGVASVPGDGSTFWFELPLTGPEPPEGC